MTAALAAKMPYLPEGGFTAEYLHSLPEDGLRRELIGGSIVVSPSATYSHNNFARWIANAIEDANPGTRHVVGTDQSMTVDDHNEPRPDIVVTLPDYLDETPFPVTGTLLVGEVVSPSSVLHDTEIKRTLYAKAGIPSYWIIVPDREAEKLALAELVLDPDTGTYRYVTHFTTGVFRTDRPWPVEIDLPALAKRMARYRRPSDKSAAADRPS